MRGFSDAALRYVLSHPWPGNVRELENAVERAVIMCEGDEVDATDFPPADPVQREGQEARVPLGMTLAEIERIAIRQALDANGGSTAKAADMLGISQRKIQYRLKEWGREP